MFAFGTLGVCTKAKVKLYPIMEKWEGGGKDRYIAIGAPLDVGFKVLQRLVKYDVYKNVFMTRWPYLAMMFGIKKKDSQSMMKHPMFGTLATIVLEGSERRLDYYEERLKALALEIKKEFKARKFIVDTMEKIEGKMMDLTSPPPHSIQA